MFFNSPGIYYMDITLHSEHLSSPFLISFNKINMSVTAILDFKIAVTDTNLKMYPLKCLTSKIYVWTQNSCLYDLYKLRYQDIYIVGIPISATHFHRRYPTIILNFSVGSRIHSCYPPDMHCRDATDKESIETKTITLHARLGPKMAFGILTSGFC